MCLVFYETYSRLARIGFQVGGAGWFVDAIREYATQRLLFLGIICVGRAIFELVTVADIESGTQQP